MALSIASCSSRGGRSYNEDAVFVGEAEGLHLLMLADGCGGHMGGDLASGAIRSAVESALPGLAGKAAGEKEMLDLLHACREAVTAVQREKNGQMCSTLVLMMVSGSTARVVHVGDSRAYHIRGGKVLYQSRDHSLAQLACMSGEIAPKDIRQYPQRNLLIYAVGGGAMPEKLTPCLLEPLEPGDGLLICSDGFWEYVLEDEMAFDLCKAENADEWLKGMLGRLAHRAPEMHDNLSAITMIYLDETCKEGPLCETSSSN